MKDKFYGGFQQTEASDEISQHAEEISIKGFTVLENVFSSEELELWRKKIDDTYAQQEKDFGREAMKSIQELDVCRAPLLYDQAFITMAAQPRILNLVQRFLGDWYILNLQNAVINRPGIEHHQSSWHRDLPYQNFVISKPLGINALFAIDEFSEKTGGTHLIPFSHKMEVLPSASYIEKNHLAVKVPAGSAIVFDCMLIHRAGVNQSQIVRRAVNHLYTTPIIKQQYDFPRALKNQSSFDPAIERLLGITAQVPLDDKAWRKARAARLNPGKPL